MAWCVPESDDGAPCAPETSTAAADNARARRHRGHGEREHDSWLWAYNVLRAVDSHNDDNSVHAAGHECEVPTANYSARSVLRGIIGCRQLLL
jgi:hypothetical protein